MTRIVVSVQTASGYDTKYAFAGSVPHVQDAASIPGDDSDASYRQHIVRNGGSPDHLGYWFRYDIDGSDIYKPTNTDIAGEISRWSVRDLRDSSSAYPLAVSFDADNTPAYNPQPIASFSMLSLDDAVTLLLSAGDSATVALSGHNGNDTLRGSFWNDELDGGKGADSMLGGDGDDLYRVDNKNDKVIEAANNGRDNVHTTINYTLSANLESVTGEGSHDLTLTGNARSNGVSGRNGDDTLKGLGGNDSVVGGNGKDVLYGGSGKDSFMFLTGPSSSNADNVRDFSHRDDFIILAQYAHPGLTDLTHPVTPFTVLPKGEFYASNSGQAHDASDRIVYDKDDGRLYFDADGTGSVARKLIATFFDHPTVTNDDILII